jgi:hypothetical protein
LLSGSTRFVKIPLDLTFERSEKYAIDILNYDSPQATVSDYIPVSVRFPQPYCLGKSSTAPFLASFPVRAGAFLCKKGCPSGGSRTDSHA